MEKATAKIKKLVASIKKQKEAFKTEAESLFKQVTAEFFKSNPKLKSFSWEQHAPYFNDGDPGRFSVHSGALKINGIEAGDNRYDNEVTETAGFTDAEFEALSTELVEFINAMPDEIMEELFEEGEVTVTPRGVTTEECDHD